MELNNKQWVMMRLLVIQEINAEMRRLKLDVNRSDSYIKELEYLKEVLDDKK